MLVFYEHMHGWDIKLLLFSKFKMNKNNMLKPYTVHYRNFQNIRLENCFYAFDAYEARTLAMEFNKFINEHPNSIDLIRCEKWIKFLVNLKLFSIRHLRIYQ